MRPTFHPNSPTQRLNMLICVTRTRLSLLVTNWAWALGSMNMSPLEPYISSLISCLQKSAVINHFPAPKSFLHLTRVASIAPINFWRFLWSSDNS